MLSPSLVDWQPMLVGACLRPSAESLHSLVIRFIERIGLLPFTVYRLLLAGLIVWHFA